MSLLSTKTKKIGKRLLGKIPGVSFLCRLLKPMTEEELFRSEMDLWSDIMMDDPDYEFVVEDGIIRWRKKEKDGLDY